MRSVAVVNQFIPQYRVPFWEGLRTALSANDISMRLLHGRAHQGYSLRGDTVKLDWSEEVPMHEFRVGGRDLVYLMLGDKLGSSDLVITTQEVRLLHNFPLLWQHMRGTGRLAFMGHGRDRAKRPMDATEQVKLWMSKRVHWWFAYNNYTVRQLEALGYPGDRITAFMNSTDTETLRVQRQETTGAELHALRQEIGMGVGPSAVYVGAVEPIKQISYLIQACRHIRTALPGFELIIIGAGSERERAVRETLGEPWIHWVAPQFGAAKVRYMLLADLCLMPAWVGLGIVDTFALGIPLVTTDSFPHSVEIDYLEHGINGWICTGAPRADGFARQVVHLLQNPTLLRALRNGALAASEAYSIEIMVERFKGGILRALDAPRYT